MNETEKRPAPFATIRDLLNYYREAEKKEADWLGLEQFERVFNRLQLIECAIPSWLDFAIDHPLIYAVERWDYEDFHVLIGRGAVKPREPMFKKLYQTGQEIWMFAQQGLGGERRGRPSTLHKQQELQIYESWSRGFHTQQELADIHRVGIATIKRIIKKYKPENRI
jgi:hypothetical protein